MSAATRTAMVLLLFSAAALAKRPVPPPLPPTEDCTPQYNGYTRRVEFSGHVWAVKDHGNRTAGPGPNFFSASTENVWVDNEGRLHLKITKSKGKWIAAEVISICSFGYGTYRFYLDSEVDDIDPNVVLGLFTWSDDPTDNYRELDIEFARWADPNNLNAQYVVQPYDVGGHTFRFWQPAAWAQSTHEFVWTPGSVEFESRIGHTTPEQGGVIANYHFYDGIPSAGNENARINLWLFRGRGPTDGKTVEVIINRFEFVPAQ